MRVFDLISALFTAVVAVAVPLASSQASCVWQCPKTDAMYNALLSSAPGPYHDIGCTYKSEGYGSCTYSTDDGILVKDWVGGNCPCSADKPCASQNLNLERGIANPCVLRLTQTVPDAGSKPAHVEDEHPPSMRARPVPRKTA